MDMIFFLSIVYKGLCLLVVSLLKELNKIMIDFEFFEE